MRKKLSSIGNSLGLVIERPILELLKFDRDTEFEMITDGRRLILGPIDETLIKSAKKIMKRHDSTLRKLAK